MILAHDLINLTLWTAVITITAPLLLLGSECLLGTTARTTSHHPRQEGEPQRASHALPRPAVDVIMPAHNEQRGLALALDSVIASLRSTDRIVLVADNCSDDTATIANRYAAELSKRKNGFATMEVLERFDDERRGKDYALQFAFDFLREPGEIDRVVVIVDSDCRIEADAIDLLATQVARTQQPAQASYLMHQPESIPMTAGSLLSEFAFTIKNHVRPLGLARIGGACTLSGSGMAFPRPLLPQLSVPSGHLVEDMRWTFDMILAGHPVRFCPDAKCSATFPTTSRATQSQRRRWEHGHLQLVCSQIPRLIRGWLHQPTWYSALAVLDLMILPLSLLLMTSLAIGIVVLIAAIKGHSVAPLLGWMAITGIAGTGMGAAWCRYRPAHAKLRTMLAIPLYVVRKVPLYVRFLLRPERAWIRTDRGG